MTHHVCDRDFVLEFISRNPGLTHLQMSMRLGRNLSSILQRLLKEKRVVRKKGLCPVKMREAYRYYIAEKGGGRAV